LPSLDFSCEPTSHALVSMYVHCLHKGIHPSPTDGKACRRLLQTRVCARSPPISPYLSRSLFLDQSLPSVVSIVDLNQSRSGAYVHMFVCLHVSIHTNGLAPGWLAGSRVDNIQGMQVEISADTDFRPLRKFRNHFFCTNSYQKAKQAIG
jgi:hypothetical protein